MGARPPSGRIRQPRPLSQAARSGSRLQEPQKTERPSQSLRAILGRTDTRVRCPRTFSFPYTLQILLRPPAPLGRVGLLAWPSSANDFAVAVRLDPAT